MKKIIVLAIAMVSMLISLSGCFWGYPYDDDRGGRDRGRGGQHDHHRDGGEYERR